MNMKTTKFLAVLAVLAMAFAAFAIVAPTESDDAAASTVSYEAVDIPTAQVISTQEPTFVTSTKYYVTADITLSVTVDTVDLYIAKGVTVTLSGTNANTRLYVVDSAVATTTGFTVTPVKDISLVMPASLTSGIVKADVAGTITIDSTITVGTSDFGMSFKDASVSKITYYAKGADAGTITLDTDNDEFTVFNGSAIVQNKESSNIVSKITFKGYVGADSTNDVTKVTRTSGTVTTLTMPQFDSNDDLTAGSMTINSGVFTIKGSSSAGSIIKNQNAFDFNFVVSGKSTDSKWYYASDALSTLSTAGYVSGDYPVLAVMGTPVVAEDSITLASIEVSYDLYLKKATMTSLTVKVNGTTNEHKIGAANLTAKIWLLQMATSVVDSIDGASTAGVKGALIGTLTLKSGTFNVPTDGLIVGYYSSPTQNIGRLNVGEGAELSLEPTTVGSRTTAGTVKISEGSEIAVFGSITSTANRTIDPAGASNDGTFSAYGNAIIGQKVYATVSHFNIENASKEIDISNDIVSDIVFKQYQTVNIIGNVNVLPGVKVVVLGTLNVTDGSTLNIAKTANITLGVLADPAITSKIMKLDNQGTIDVAGEFIVGTESGAEGKVTSDGTITVDGTFTAEAAIELTDGKMTIGTTGVLGGTGLVVGDEATLAIDGSVSGTIGVKGAVRIDGSVSGALGFNMQADDATIYFSEVKFTGAATNDLRTITISDVDLKLAKGRAIGTAGEYGDPLGETITIVASTQNDILYGLTVAEDVVSYTYNNVKYFLASLNLSGSLSADLAGQTDITITLDDNNDLTKAYHEVDGTLSIGKDVALTINAGATLTVNAESEMYYTSTDAGDLVNGGTITVYGTIYSKGAITGTINATLYTVDLIGVKTYVYTTLASAIEAEAEKLTINGINKVTANLTIPAGVTIDSATGASIVVGSVDDRSVIATLSEGAVLKNASVIVYGTFIVEDKVTGLKNTTVTSDVSSTNGNTVKYTNVYYALLNAQEGEVVKITTPETVTIAMNTTIPAGVTLEVPASGSLAVLVGKILTVNGVLDSWYGVKAVYANGTAAAFGLTEDDTHAKIVVNGLFVSTDAITYDNYMVPGAYFQTTTTSPYYAVAAVPVAAALMPAIDDEAITLHGELSIGNVAFVGIEGATITLASDAQVTAGTVTITDAQIVSASADVATSYFKGTITGTSGSVKITDMVGFKVADNLDDSETYLADNTEIKASTVTGHKSSNAISVSAGIIYAYGAVNANKLTVASDASFIISGANNSFTAGTSMTVNGNVTISDNGTATIPSLFVTGSFLVISADPVLGVAAGTANVTKVYAGFTKADDVYKVPTTTGATPIITAETLGTGLQAVFALTGSVISESITDGMTKSTFIVEDSEYLAVFVSASVSDMYAFYVQAPELENALFTNWTYISSGEVKVVDKDNKSSLSTARTYTAKINYNLYEVVILTDAGVKSVSIDGIELLNEKNNEFVLPVGHRLVAGTHTVTYTMKAGYSGTPTLKTVDGTILKDYKFITAGTPETGDHITINLQLNGTDPTPEPEPTPTPEPEKQSEWTITTILLCVLVVLIAIMAVIVALRLNRN